MVNRRDFLLTAGTGIVALVLTPIVSACGSDDSGSSTSVSSTTPPPSCDGAGEVSTFVQGHTHTLCVPAADLAEPPAAGVPYVTSFDDGHSHYVLLSEAELSTVSSGGSVTVTTTLEQGHTHDFSIQQEATRSEPSPITPMPYPV